MRRLWEAIGLDGYGTEWVPVEAELPLTPSFEVVRRSSAGWILILHKPLKHTRWVREADIVRDGIAVAYYDANPTFLPPGEKAD